MNTRRRNTILALSAGISTALMGVSQVNAAGNPFELSTASGSTLMVADAGQVKAISVLEGKCGAGKCGSKRIRKMMDSNGNSRIEREEYVGWAVRQAEIEFEKIAEGMSQTDAEKVFKHFESLDYHLGS